jgi:uncharacterized protein (DUF983 family)
MTSDKKPRGYFASVFGCYCPRCREGKLFKNKVSANIRRNTDMNERCTVCGQPSEIEVGFYYGTGYVSYMLAVMVSGATFVAWWLFVGFSFSDNRFIWWIVINAVLLIGLQPWLMRLSRSLWISWFVRYDGHWNEKLPDDYERIVPGQMNNW